VTRLSKTILLGAVVLLAITVPFSHEYQPKKSLDKTNNINDYHEIIKERNNLTEDNLSRFEKGDISKEQYLVSFRQVISSSKLKLRNNKKERLAIKSNESYLGYTSYKNFLLGIGFPISGFILSILFLNIVVRNIQNSFKKKYYIIVSFVFIAAWGYWLAWSCLDFAFDPIRGYDWERKYYNIALYFLPTTIFIASYFLFTYFDTIEQKFRDAIKNMFGYIFESSNDLKEETIEDHKIKRGKLIRETLDNVK